MFRSILVLLLISTLSFAANTGSITLQGTVPAVTAITVTPVGSYNNLDLTTTQTNLVVANVTESNNTALGYKVTVASANSGFLKNGTLGSMAYTAKYNNTAFTLSSTPVQVTSQGAQTTVVNVSKSLSISYTGQPSANMMQGNYSDTLTFTITAN